MVLNQTVRFIRGHFLLAFLFLTPIFSTIGRVAFESKLIKIAELENYSTDEKRDIFNTFDPTDQNDQGFPLDPMDLMNRIKQVGAMENATTPSAALDEALNAFNELDY